MRTRSAALALCVAAVLGAGTGVVLLPDRESFVTARPSVAATTPTSAASTPVPGGSPSPSPSPSASASAGPPGEGPPASTDLLTTADLRAAGLKATELPPRRLRLELTGCTGGGYQRTTLAEAAKSGAPIERSWENKGFGATQEAVYLHVSEDSEAAAIHRRVLRIFESCQGRPPTYWVHGPTHTELLGPRVTVSWLGSVDGSFNKTGRAPKDAGISGGVVVVRNGERLAVIHIGWCAGEGESPACLVAPGHPERRIAELGRIAAERLG